MVRRWHCAMGRKKDVGVLLRCVYREQGVLGTAVKNVVSLLVVVCRSSLSFSINGWMECKSVVL
jgi:hypothetical protein